MARSSSSAPTPSSTVLASIRLLFLYTALCYALLEIGFASRDLWENIPFLPQSSSILTDSAYPAHLAGVNVSLEQYTDTVQRQIALAELAGAGFDWVRQRADWRVLEPSPREYNWTQMDGIVTDVAAAGLEFVVVLDGSPAWARRAEDIAPTDNPFAPPADTGNFAHFAAAFAQRYGNRIRFYQIWDEPNIAPHWGNRWIEPVDYSRLLAQTSPAIRAADPDAVILLAALAPTADRGHTAIDEVYYLRRLYAAGAAPYFDAVAAEPFGFGLPPGDSHSRVEILNFQRVGILRRVMLAAGDGTKPIWAVRYGWNRTTNSVWQTVTPEAQSRYVEQATALAQSWPWLAGLGWAIDRPAAPNDAPLWGFALHTPDGQPTPLLETFARINGALASPRCAIPDRCAERDNLEGEMSYSTHLSGVVVWLIALLWILWRGWRAGQVAGIGKWLARFATQPLPVKAGVWAVLAVVYYFATWPPLIGLCWLAAALLLIAEPLTGLLLAAALLPFHFQHKELALVGTTLAVSPAYAALLCSVPGLVHRWITRKGRLRFVPNATDWLALGWLTISALSAISVWDWAVMPGALWWLVIGPLLLYALARKLIANAEQQLGVAMAIAGGSMAVALFGLVLWSRGDGVVVDGVRRLIGLTFSPNQTALMLVRGFFVTLGVAVASRGRWRWVWATGAGVIGLALLLTGSRGSLFLGIPAGALLFFVLQPGIQSRLKARPWLVSALLAAGIVGVSLVLGDRLLNSETVSQRLVIWQSSLDLWRSYPWLGIGPGGFFWHYPAFLSAAAATEPNLLHPHNLWLEFATGGGVLGLVWLLAFGYWLVQRISSRIRRINAVEAGVLAALMAGLAHAQVDAFGALPELAAWNWLAIGLLRRRSG